MCQRDLTTNPDNGSKCLWMQMKRKSWLKLQPSKTFLGVCKILFTWICSYCSGGWIWAEYRPARYNWLIVKLNKVGSCENNLSVFIRHSVELQKSTMEWDNSLFRGEGERSEPSLKPVVCSSDWHFQLRLPGKIWSVLILYFRRMGRYPIRIRFISAYEQHLNLIWWSPILCAFSLLQCSCYGSDLCHLRGKKSDMGQLKHAV